MTEKNNEPQKGIYALVSGAGTVMAKDGLVAVIMVEKARLPGKEQAGYKTTVYGDPAVVLLKGSTGQWHVTGPVDQVKTDDLLRLAEGLRQTAEGRGKPPAK